MGLSGEVGGAAKAAAEGGTSGGDEGSVEKVGMSHGFSERELGRRQRMCLMKWVLEYLL